MRYGVKTMETLYKGNWKKRVCPNVEVQVNRTVNTKFNMTKGNWLTP